MWLWDKVNAPENSGGRPCVVRFAKCQTYSRSPLWNFIHTQGTPTGFDGTWHCGHSLTYVSFWNRFSRSNCKQAQGGMCGYKHSEHSPTTFSASFQFLRNELSRHRKRWMSSSKPTKCCQATEKKKKKKNHIDVLSRSAVYTRTSCPWCHLKNKKNSRHAVNRDVPLQRTSNWNR